MSEGVRLALVYVCDSVAFILLLGLLASFMRE